MGEWEMFVCRCGSSALGGPEEVVHFNSHWRGRRDPSLIERLVLVPKEQAAIHQPEELALVA
jgi:hypothetical protein